VNSLNRIAKRLRAVPLNLGRAVAKIAAPAITDDAQASFAAGETVYGDARPDGKSGPLTLEKSGRLRGGIKFVSIGSIMRAALTVPYARFMIKYGILPRGGAEMPTAWREHIADLTHAEALKALEG